MGSSITILADRGDYRGLGEAFERLTNALDDRTLPKDAKAKESEAWNRTCTANELARCTIGGHFPPGVLVKFLRKYEHSPKAAERLAVEHVLDFSPGLRKAMAEPVNRDGEKNPVGPKTR